MATYGACCPAFSLKDVMDASHVVLPEERGRASTEESDGKKNLITTFHAQQHCRNGVQICERLEDVRNTFTTGSCSQRTLARSCCLHGGQAGCSSSSGRHRDRTDGWGHRHHLGKRRLPWGAAGGRAGFLKAFNVFLSPGANPADSPQTAHPSWSTFQLWLVASSSRCARTKPALRHSQHRRSSPTNRQQKFFGASSPTSSEGTNHLDLVDSTTCVGGGRRASRREMFSSSALDSQTPCSTHIHPATGKWHGWRAGGWRNQPPIPPRAPS